MTTSRRRRPKAVFVRNGPELEELTGFTANAVRVQSSTGRGALTPILTRFGNRLGVWLSDWEALAESQRRHVDYRLLRSDETLEGTQAQPCTAAPGRIDVPGTSEHANSTALAGAPASECH